MDVKSFYANIPNSEGISAIKKVKQCSSKDNNNINSTNSLRDGSNLCSHFYKHVVGKIWAQAITFLRFNNGILFHMVKQLKTNAVQKVE